jgi:chromate transporter
LQDKKKTVPPGYLNHFLNFFQLGATAFGGPAMIAQIRKFIVIKKTWMGPRSFNAGVALCQVIPGAIVMQLAAYIGLKLKGIRGSLVAFIGFGLPAFIMMLILSILYKKYYNVSSVEIILANLRVVIAAIVAHSAYSFGKNYIKNINDGVITAVAAVLFYIKLHPAIVLAFAAMLGLVLSKPDIQTTPVKSKSNTFYFFLLVLSVVVVSVVVLGIINKDFFTLATLMLRIDLFSFGGGLAAVPIMFHEFVDVYNWLDKKTFLDGMILGQSTPGSIIVTATFVGYMRFGLIGALLATIFVFTPSFLILMGITPFFDRLRTYPQFNKVINGVLCSFVGLLIIVTYNLSIDINWSITSSIMAVIVFIMLLFGIDTVWVIIGGILFSLVGFI